MTQVQDTEFVDSYTLSAKRICSEYEGESSEDSSIYVRGYEEGAASGTYIDFESDTESTDKISASEDDSSDIPQINKEYTLYRPLAKGCNGQVSLGNYNGELVAIKQALSPNTTGALAKEVKAHQILQKHCDQYDRYVGALLAVDTLFCPKVTVYRFYAQGNLEHYLQKHTELDISKRLALMIDLSSGLKFIHSAEILHKDLKAENILINDDGTLRITDFGCATHFSSRVVDFGGDYFTRSPKMLANTDTFYARKKSADPNPAKDLENFSKVDDIYSLALVFSHILMGQLPFAQFRNNNNMRSFYHHVVIEKQRPDMTVIPKASAKLLTFLSTCWHEDEKIRPIIDNINDTLIDISKTVRRGQVSV